MSSSNLRIKAEIVGDQKLDHESRHGHVELGGPEFGENIGFDLVKQLRRIDQQDHSSLGFQIDDPGDQAHLVRRQFGRRLDCIDLHFHDLGYAVDEETRDDRADRHHENALGPRMFRRAQIKPAAQIDDRHHAAAQIHHAIDEGGRLRQPRDVIGPPRDLADRGDGDTVVLIAQPKNDELLVCHDVRFRLRFRFARTDLVGKNTTNQFRPEKPVRRQQRDQPLPVFEPADRGDFGVTVAAGEQGRRRIDDVRIDPEYLPGCIHDHADRAIAQRHHHDLATRFVPPSSRHPKQRAERHQRQQAVPQRDNAQHRGFRPRQRRDMVRQRNDLPHAVERKRIFLLAEAKAQQRDQRLDRRRSRDY